MTLKLVEVWGFFAWVFAVCMLAGVVRVYRRFERERLSIFEILGELFISGFIGLMTFLLCVAVGVITLPPRGCRTRQHGVVHLRHRRAFFNAHACALRSRRRKKAWQYPR